MHLTTEEKTTANWMKEAQKGYIRVAALIVLSRKPTHGYELMKEIKDKTRGFYKPTPGGVYPILRDLEESKYIKGEWGIQKNRKIKVYKITEKGKHIIKHAIIKQSEIANSLNTLAEEFAREVLKIEPKIGSMPIMPSPFAPFLEENKKTKTIEELELQRKNLKQHIKIFQEELRIIEKEVREAKTKKVTKEDLQLRKTIK
jgi:DNA-binding PadR family transcriptional regulator